MLWKVEGKRLQTANLSTSSRTEDQLEKYEIDCLRYVHHSLFLRCARISSIVLGEVAASFSFCCCTTSSTQSADAVRRAVAMDRCFHPSTPIPKFLSLHFQNSTPFPVQFMVRGKSARWQNGRIILDSHRSTGHRCPRGSRSAVACASISVRSRTGPKNWLPRGMLPVSRTPSWSASK